MSPEQAACEQWLQSAEQSLARFEPQGLEKAMAALSAAVDGWADRSPQGAEAQALHALRQRFVALAERCGTLRQILMAALQHAATPQHSTSLYSRSQRRQAPLHSLFHRSV